MGRPLRQDTIEAMELVASGKTLSKQVGYNKYHVVEDEDEIVRLAEVAADDDVVLVLHDGYEDFPVLKITKHFFFTSKDAYAYTLDEEGKVVFEKTGVDIYSDPTPTIRITCEPATASIVATYKEEEYRNAEGEDFVEITLENKSDSVAYTVSCEHYVSQSGSTSVSKTVSLALEEYTLSVSVSPEDAADATVTLTADGYEQSENSITVPYGTSVAVAVAKEGWTFVLKNGEEAVESPITVDGTIALTAEGSEVVLAPEELNPEPGQE